MNSGPVGSLSWPYGGTLELSLSEAKNELRAGHGYPM